MAERCGFKQSGFQLFAELASSGAIKAHFCVAVKYKEVELHSVSDCCLAKGAQACVEDLRRRETCETGRGRQGGEGGWWWREGAV